VRLFGELGPEPARERARRRLEAFVAAEAGVRLGPLKRLRAAVADGVLKGLARGVAYRLIEAGGLIDRRAIAGEVTGLSQAERRALRSLGVRFGAFSLYMPGLLEPGSRAFAGAFAAQEAPQWAPPLDRPSALPHPTPGPKVLAAWGLRACGAYAVPAEALERLDDILRAAPREAGGAALSDRALEPLGWPRAAVAPVLRSLGYAPARRKVEGAAEVWRRRAEASQPAPIAVRPDSPFAALAVLTAPPAVRRKRRRARKPKTAASP
jgi:ATP-dependent RNA helicase SUPV3L1/SUV3